MEHKRLPAVTLSLAILIGAIAATPVFASSTSVSVAPVSSSVEPAATSGVLEGIDVSHWQGAIDWTRVAGAGKSFAIIKASESVDFVDARYAINRSAAQAAGLWTGAYHFARPDSSTNDAIHEADHFVATISLGTHDLIPALDLEDSGGLSTTALTSWVSSWLGEVSARTGIRPMIYTSPAFWKKYLADTRALADAGYKILWIAHWGVSTPTVPAQNWGGHGWTFWQYSNCGTVAGISGCVDLDRYNGTDLRLQAFSSFNVKASVPAQVKQRQAAASTVAIARTNFTSAVTLAVSGLPAGATADFNASPTTTSSSALQVATASTTPPGTYPLTITGTGQGLTRTTNVSLTVVDGLPPTISVPSTRLVTNSTLGSTLPVRVSWTASDPSGLASTGLQRSVNGGTWGSVALAAASTTSVAQAEPTSGTFQERVRATDRFSNTSAWATGPVIATGVTQQAAASIHYTGTWLSGSSTNVSGGTYRYTYSAGATASYTFTASSVGWVGIRGPYRGSVRVYIDGALVGTVNLRATSYSMRSLVYTANWPTAATHTLKLVVVTGRVDLDAFASLRIR